MPATRSPAIPVVLVVEDEPILRIHAVEMLIDAGFRAIGVVDAAAALHVLSFRDDVAIVFSDIEMPPGMDGLELATTIRNRWPPVEIVLTSGRRHPNEAELVERSRFLPKPYRRELVVETMRQLAA